MRIGLLQESFFPTDEDLKSQSQEIDDLETVVDLSFCRFFGSFEPIFDSNLGGYINFRILPPKFESKIGQNGAELWVFAAGRGIMEAIILTGRWESWDAAGRIRPTASLPVAAAARRHFRDDGFRGTFLCHLRNVPRPAEGPQCGSDRADPRLPEVRQHGADRAAGGIK